MGLLGLIFIRLNTTSSKDNSAWAKSTTAQLFLSSNRVVLERYCICTLSVLYPNSTRSFSALVSHSSLIRVSFESHSSHIRVDFESQLLRVTTVAKPQSRSMLTLILMLAEDYGRFVIPDGRCR
jgi:hypothetical protein